MGQHKVSDLNELFVNGEAADKELFSEMRSNIQLVAGEHYAKKGNKFWNRLRDNKDLSYDQKIRLSKNHIRKIALIYRNSITSYSPGVKASAKDKNSMQHQKKAELVNSVWANGKNKHDFNKKINQAAADFINIGEVWTKFFWDPNAGKFLGMQAQVDESGEVTKDDNGNPIPSNIAKFSGDVVWERLFAFNIIRPAGLKSIHDAEWLCHRKMVPTSDLKLLVRSSDNLDSEEKKKILDKIHDSQDLTYIILDNNTGTYRNIKDQTMVKEWFFKPCPKYPMGYFYISTQENILFEGELPFGIFPLVHGGFDEIQTSPRYRSIIKQLRPYQIEINRCASKMAEHQVTLGDDKVLIQNGTKLTPGVALPGVRSLQYSGMQPIVMAGRSGDQYLGPMNSNISEMYAVAMVDEQKEEKGQFDAYSMLFRSIKDKKKFSVYSDSFESYLKNCFKTYIELCQKYYNEQHLIPAIGKSEYINIPEFKGADELCYSTILEAQSDDSETKLGRQMMLDKIVQYVGPQLQRDDIGKIIKSMPYANDDEILGDLTMDYDCAINYMLAMDRGQPPVPNMYDSHEYLIKKFTSRTRQPDFQLLPPQIQQIYRQAIQTHEQLKTQQELLLKQAQSEFIPTGGYLVACDFYIPDPQNPQKLPKRVRLPSEALSWLIKQMDSQGSDQATLEGVNKGAQGEMSSMLLNQLHQNGGGQPIAPQAMPPAHLMPQMGHPSPGGMVNGYR